jgi:molybdenum cofactor biosynthesis enzyme MoaA
VSQLIQIQRASHTRPAPILPLQQLDVLWLQITGTRCNIACRHCFISCGPKDTRHAFMTVEQVRETLAAAERQGVREYYMTGGEPFLHPDLHALVALTLKQGPLTILTNGILIDEAEAAWVAETQRSAAYSFDLRVSLDGSTAELNDPIRGKGTFEKITLGIRRLAEQGVNPIITVTEVYEGMGNAKGRAEFLAFLHRIGLEKPRLKFLAPFLIGREARRNRPYREEEHLEEGDLTPQEYETLQCASCRIVTAEGVYPCPLLINELGALMAGRLEEALRPIQLSHAACYTCHVSGVTCRN